MGGQHKGLIGIITRATRFHLPSSIFHLPTTQGPAPCKHPRHAFSLFSPLSSVFCPLSSLFFLTLFLSSPVLGDVQEHISKLHPYVTLQEQYDDNIYLTQQNPQSDFITTITPGLKYVAKGPAYNFDLGFELGMNFYASNPENNYMSYLGRLNTSYSFSPRWTVSLNESLIRSRNNLQSYSLATPAGQQTFTSSNTGQVLYLRNTFQPSIEYKFGRENLVTLNYLNMVYREDGEAGNNSLENSVSPRLTYWFDVRNGITLDYAYTRGDFENESQPNWAGNNLGGRYMYRFNPRTTAFGEYRYLKMDFESPRTNYSVHSLSAGLNHAFSPSLTGMAQFGWFRQVGDVGSPLSGPVCNFSLTQLLQRTRLTLAFEGGYQEQYFTSDNLGISLYTRARATVTHQFRERLSVGLTGALERDEYQNPDRIDYTYGITGTFPTSP